jgi:hypothetical protein
MVNFTRKNKLGGKKRTNKRKVSSRKYKKRGGMFDGFKDIKVKLYDMHLPDPIGIEYYLTRNQSYSGYVQEGFDTVHRISDNKGFEFWGYHPQKKLIHLKYRDSFVQMHTLPSTYLKPEEFDGKFKFDYETKKNILTGQRYTVWKKIKFIDINNLEAAVGGGGKRKTLKKSKKSKKVKKSRKNRK